MMEETIRLHSLPSLKLSVMTYFSNVFWVHAGNLLLVSLSENFPRHLPQASGAHDASIALMLRGGRTGGQRADPKGVADALWALVLGYLDASLPGEAFIWHASLHGNKLSG